MCGLLTIAMRMNPPIAMTRITGLFTTLQGNLLTLVVPVSVVGLILWILSIALAPALPEWAQGMRGYFQRTMLAVVFAGFVVTFVTALYGIGGGQ